MISTVLTWNSLPTEIRHLILHTIGNVASRLSSYASVCREWQKVIETFTFARLVVTPSRISQLDMFASPRRAILKCIELRISLQEYDCSQCRSMPNMNWIARDQSIVEHALRALMITLSAWEPSDSTLTLDISVHSPSDSKHHYRSFSFDEDDDYYHGAQSVDIEGDMRHGWRGNRQVSFPPGRSLFRVFSFIDMTEDFWVNLPHVEIITCIQDRRQTRRQWHQLSLQRLIPYFHGLETLYYEPWRDECQQFIDGADQDYLGFFETLSEYHLKHLVIFEDFDDYYFMDYRDSFPPIDPMVVRKAKPAVGEVLARVSLGLQSLSASLLLDARHFFDACQSTWVWNGLTSLALTSRALSPNDLSQWKTNKMLQSAALIAMKMPKLQIMALWNYHRKFVGMFLYQTAAEQNPAKVTWRATWDIDFTPTVIQLWEEVALGHDRLGLLIVKDTLDAGAACKSHGHAIEQLRIPCHVAHPDSVLQIQREFEKFRMEDLEEYNRTRNPQLDL